MTAYPQSPVAPGKPVSPVAPAAAQSPTVAIQARHQAEPAPWSTVQLWQPDAKMAFIVQVMHDCPGDACCQYHSKLPLTPTVYVIHCGN